MVDMNDSKSLAQAFRCYEQLRAIDDMSHFLSSVQGFRCYAQLWVMVDMNKSGSWA